VSVRALAAPALTDDERLRLAFVHLDLSREAALDVADCRPVGCS